MIRLADFEGRWRVRRRIDDAYANQTGHFEGEAAFSPEAGGLHYQERGVLTMGTAAPMQAERAYLWRDAGATIEVLFADGRPFHEFAPGHTDDATHYCDPDVYRVEYEFADWPEWRAVWRVAGPRKAYEMTSRYSRVSA